MKNPKGPMGNQTRDLSACSAMPQPTTLPHAPLHRVVCAYFQDAFLAAFRISLFQRQKCVAKQVTLYITF